MATPATPDATPTPATPPPTPAPVGKTRRHLIIAVAVVGAAALGLLIGVIVLATRKKKTGDCSGCAGTGATCDKTSCTGGTLDCTTCAGKDVTCGTEAKSCNGTVDCTTCGGPGVTCGTKAKSCNGGSSTLDCSGCAGTGVTCGTKASSCVPTLPNCPPTSKEPNQADCNCFGTPCPLRAGYNAYCFNDTSKCYYVKSEVVT